MANEQNTALAQARVNNVAKYFMDQVSRYVQSLPDVIGGGEAGRLTANLVIKASSMLEEQGKDWSNVDAAKFMMDAIKMVTMGLDAGNNECYPIPYNNNKTGKVELQCSPSAKGYQKLAIQYAVGKKIAAFSCYTIKEGDKFTLKRTPGNDIWEYAEDLFGSGKARGYVTIVDYADGTSQVMTHSIEDIEKRRKASKAPNSPAWTKWYDEMAHAKAIRRHATRISLKLPDGVKKAMDEVEEQEMKDVTPETIELELPAVQPAPETHIEVDPEPVRIEPVQQEEPEFPDQLPLDESWMR